MRKTTSVRANSEHSGALKVLRTGRGTLRSIGKIGFLIIIVGFSIFLLSSHTYCQNERPQRTGLVSSAEGSSRISEDAGEILSIFKETIAVAILRGGSYLQYIV